MRDTAKFTAWELGVHSKIITDLDTYNFAGVPSAVPTLECSTCLLAGSQNSQLNVMDKCVDVPRAVLLETSTTLVYTKTPCNGGFNLRLIKSSLTTSNCEVAREDLGASLKLKGCRLRSY